MIPLWRPLFAALVALGLAWPLDHFVPLVPRKSLVRIPVLVMTSLVAIYLWLAAPVLLALAVLIVGWSIREARKKPRPAPNDRAPFEAFLGATALLLFVMLAARPAAPCYWDAFVWLGKARVASLGPARLIAGGLAPSTPVFIPQGYPVFEPLAVALLGDLSPETRDVVAGGVGFEILALFLFMGALAEDAASDAVRQARLAVVALMLVCSPLVVVHLRSAYVDLPLGLMAAALAMLVTHKKTAFACAVLAMAIAVTKDEGLVHVVVIGLAALVRSRTEQGEDRIALRNRALATLGGGLATAGSWHLRLHLANVANTDHAISVPTFARILPLGKFVVEHVSDFRSWGALWVLALGAAVAIVLKPKSAPKSAIWFASLFFSVAFVMFGGLLSIPGQVMEFAAGGSLLNRLGVQLSPYAALLVASWVVPAADWM
ncbi:MAG TPA: hypothetical protein VF407_18515, partial [Polyangiaceae bacterium]